MSSPQLDLLVASSLFLVFRLHVPMQWHAGRSFPGCVRSNLPFGGIEAGDADRLRAVLCHDLVPASRHGLDVETCVDEADGPSNESALHLAAHRVDALAGHRTALVTQKGDRW